MLNKISLMIVLIVGAMILNSCNTEPGSEELYEQVEIFHDQAMGHMGTLYKAQKKVKEKLAALDSTASESTVKELETQLKTFTSARDQMNSWMRGFGAAYDEELPEKEKVEILKKELLKVKDMSKEMDEAVALSKKL